MRPEVSNAPRPALQVSFKHHDDKKVIEIPLSTPSDTLKMAADHEQEHPYHPKDAIGASIKATAITTAAGLFVSSVQNTLTKQNVGSMGTFTRFGTTTAVFGMRP